MVIKFNSRYRKNIKGKEYYLQKRVKGVDIRRGWFTIKELSELPECDICPETLRDRILTTTFPYKNLWEAVTEPKSKKFITKIIPIDYTFIKFMMSWPVGSLNKQAKILQGKFYD